MSLTTLLYFRLDAWRPFLQHDSLTPFFGIVNRPESLAAVDDVATGIAAFTVHCSAAVVQACRESVIIARDISV